MKKIDLLNKYGLRLASYKYVLPGGELMKYIGQTVVCVMFKKDPESGGWTNEFQEATILSLGEFDPMQMTWLCKYKINKTGEESEVRILPEGYSFEGKNPEDTGKMLRFLPLSKHFEMMEDDNFFHRLGELWETKESLSPELLMNIAVSKGQEEILKYTHNIGALVRLNEEPEAGESRYLWIRIQKLNFHHKAGSKFNLRFSNNERSWSFLVDTDKFEQDFEEGLGTFKIIDLSEGTAIKPQVDDIEPDKE